MSKYFKPEEFTCKCGCGLNNVDPQLVELLEAAREIAGIPFVINSGCRCEEHNKNVGGTENSTHIEGKAADIRCTDSRSRFKIKQALYAAGAKRIGHHPSFIHVDVATDKSQEVEFIY